MAPPLHPTTTAWFAVFAEDVAALTDFAEVIVPEFSNEATWQHARWQGRPELLSVDAPASVTALTAAATAAGAAATLGDLKTAVVSAINAVKTAFEQVRLPVRGDECLVTIDNRQNLWIIAWWPVSV